MRDYDFNDKVTSWYCGKNVAYDFCDDSTNCEFFLGNRGAGNVKSPYIKRNDAISVVYLSEYDA